MVTVDILNISLPLSDALSDSLSAEEVLQPYLDASLTLTVPPAAARETPPTAPLFTLFYIYHPPSTPSNVNHDSATDIFVTPPCTQLLPLIADAATQNAEAMFWKAMEKLKAAGIRPNLQKDKEMEDPGQSGKGVEGTEDTEAIIDSFWPPLDDVEDETSDEW